MDAGAFFGRLGPLMADSPPYTDDGLILLGLGRLGIQPGKPYDIRAVDPAIARGGSGRWTG
jgi:hypothetical protein